MFAGFTPVKKEEIPWSTLFSRKASWSNFPSTSGLTECVSVCVCVCVLVFVCVCTHVYVFGWSPIKQLMLAVFNHCEMGGLLSVSPLVLTHEKHKNMWIYPFMEEFSFELFLNNLSIISYNDMSSGRKKNVTSIKSWKKYFRKLAWAFFHGANMFTFYLLTNET